MITGDSRNVRPKLEAPNERAGVAVPLINKPRPAAAPRSMGSAAPPRRDPPAGVRLMLQPPLNTPMIPSLLSDGATRPSDGPILLSDGHVKVLGTVTL